MNKKAIEIKAEFPYRNSPLSLTFEAEIKRLAVEKGREIRDLLTLLAEKTGISERHFYNYRSGKTSIPGEMIPVLCKQFESNALAMSIVVECNKTHYDEMDMFDLGRFASRSIQDVLRCHDDFIDAFDDGVVDGHELTKLTLSTAKIVRNANRLCEIAKGAHDRRTMPAAA